MMTRIIDMDLSTWSGRYPLLALAGVLLVLARTIAAADTNDVSPHWDKSACSTCHINPQPVDASDLKLDTYSELCVDCHGESSASACPHPTNLPALVRGQGVLPESHRSALVGGQIVCTTCHSVKLQCTGGSRERYQNPTFLRNGPFRHPSQACFECHDTGHYEKLNPHQPVQAGKTQSCLFCHNDVPDAEKGTNSGTRLGGNLQCTGCHRVAPHPLSMAPGTGADEWTHLVVPAQEILDRMRAAEARTGIKLPLAPGDGAVMCATCHNPHDPGLSRYPHRTEDGAVSKLRMADICEACHDK